jgi:uncharacterized protein YjiS (DUF1127 family)
MANPISRQSAESIVSDAVLHRQQVLGHILGTLWLWTTRRRTRRTLGKLAEQCPHLLADIGVTRAAARREAAKWFWMP